MLRNVLTNEVSWRALMAPNTGVGAGEGEGDAGGLPPEGDVGGDDGGQDDTGAERHQIGQRERKPGERTSPRDALRSGFDDARRAPAKDRRTGRFAPAGARRDAQDDGGQQQEDLAADGQPAEGAGATSVKPPEGWPPAAANEWASMSPTAQAVVAKRFAETQKGVTELKARYADIDRAVQPHLDAIRSHGHTPAQAVHQLFAWFQALAQNPGQAFPALARSFNYDLSQFVQPPAGVPQQPAQAGGQASAGAAAEAEGDIPPSVQRYIDTLASQFGGHIGQLNQGLEYLHRNYQAANAAKTNEVLMSWSKDKPHFERVRQTMAQLISSGAVPLVEGRVDLDGAYAKAVWMDDTTRAEMLAKQEADKAEAAKAAAAAAAKAQADKVGAARRANVSLTPGAPGTDPGAAARGQRKKGMSVRESIQQAREELQA